MREKWDSECQGECLRQTRPYSDQSNLTRINAVPWKGTEGSSFATGAEKSLTRLKNEDLIISTVFGFSNKLSWLLRLQEVIKWFFGKNGLAEIYRIWWSWKKLASEKPFRRLLYPSSHSKCQDVIGHMEKTKKRTGRIVQRRDGRLLYLLTVVIPKNLRFLKFRHHYIKIILGRNPKGRFGKNR